MKTLAWMLACASLLPDAAAQFQVGKWTPAALEAGDKFGESVSVSGDWAVVGAIGDDDTVDQSGAAYVYQRVGADWFEYQKLKASDPQFGVSFGAAVAICGGTIVVGATEDSPQGIFAAGSAYIFELVGGTWVETAKVWASDAGADEHFANAVAASDTRVLIADSLDNTSAAGLAGSCYVFEKSGTNWAQTAKLTASDAAYGDRFGTSVALSGDTAVIGAIGANVGTRSDAGAAYVFDIAGALWVEATKLTASDPGASDYFGTAVAVGVDTAVVGSPAHNAPTSNSGAAYVFERVLGAWGETQELTALDGDSQDFFGTSAALSGDVVLIGAPADEDWGASSGSAYAFRRSSGSWTQIAKLLSRDPSRLFGDQVGLSDRSALAGAWSDDGACVNNSSCNSGAAYVFELAPDCTQYGSCAAGAPCNNLDRHGGCANSSGRGAVLCAGGSSSVASDDLRFEATQLPASVNAILFMGPSQVLAPLGDGLRVVGAGTSLMFRFSLQQADASGLLLRGPGLIGYSQGFSPLGQIRAGQSWNFQCWFRDSAGPCAHTTNLTNGVHVQFTP